MWCIDCMKNLRTHSVTAFYFSLFFWNTLYINRVCVLPLARFLFSFLLLKAHCKKDRLLWIFSKHLLLLTIMMIILYFSSGKIPRTFLVLFLWMRSQSKVLYHTHTSIWNLHSISNLLDDRFEQCPGFAHCNNIALKSSAYWPEEIWPRKNTFYLASFRSTQIKSTQMIRFRQIGKIFWCSYPVIILNLKLHLVLLRVFDMIDVRLQIWAWFISIRSFYMNGWSFVINASSFLNMSHTAKKKHWLEQSVPETLSLSLKEF